MICFINNISDILIDEESNQEYIFIELSPLALSSYEGKKEHFSGNNIPYKINRSEHVELFNSLTNIKENGKRFVYKDYDSLSSYNFFFLANEIEYDEECQKLKLHRPYPYTSDEILYVREYFSIT